MNSSPLKRAAPYQKPPTDFEGISIAADQWRLGGYLDSASFSTRKNKTPTACAVGVSEFNLDD
ncbi:hypothetical protein, partial [Pseudomonas protegens]|uniref:hypothetical protein n=1 Tax=Pseudomonas protegens TaxID=380021 RepID=UPI001C7DEE83